MSISVCIATHERAELLRGTLESLARQRLPPLEVIVSDSSAGPAGRDVVSAFASRHPGLRVRHLPSSRRQRDLRETT